VPICPSFKATDDLRLSPKGRADGFRALERTDLPKSEKLRLEDDLAQSLDLCLSCKACAGACPVMVDIPEMKSRFLEVRYATHRRPIADHLAIALEGLAPFILRVSGLAAPIYNLLRKPIGEFAGLVDLPAMNVWAGLRKAITVEQARQRDWAANTVFVVPDAFTSLFDGTAQAGVAAALTALGYAVQPVALAAGPKAAHVRGARKIFEKRAKRLHRQLTQLSTLGRPMLGFDPAFVLMARQELLPFGAAVPLRMVHEFLSDELAAGKIWPRAQGRPGITIALHCTEASADPAAGRTWQRVMDALGFEARIAPTGCCGMAGLFGHEAAHQSMSRTLFDLSWKAVSETENATATGFSCRCQSARLGRLTLPHPMTLVAQALGSRDD
jgi:Fe-S oxidoreductase